MSNLELAKFVLAGIRQAAAMVIWYLRGNIDRAREAESKFDDLLKALEDE